MFVVLRITPLTVLSGIKILKTLSYPFKEILEIRIKKSFVSITLLFWRRRGPVGRALLQAPCVSPRTTISQSHLLFPSVASSFERLWAVPH